MFAEKKMTSSCCNKKQDKAPIIAGAFILFKPLIVIVSLTLIMSVALAYEGSISFMNAAMGIFLAFLACLKLFNLRGFSESFSKYDVVAEKFSYYGFLYPFIELFLSSLYLSGLWPVFTNSLMVIVMVVGTIGVIKILISGKSVQCACVGTSFNLPVGKITFFENMAMMLMALLNLFTLLVL